MTEEIADTIIHYGTYALSCKTGSRIGKNVESGV
jgi:hypothetical protein